MPSFAEAESRQPFMAGAAAIPGDISAEKLDAAIEEKIDQHFGRWDVSANGPGKGRGIADPWSKGIGPLLLAHYAQETSRAEFDQVIPAPDRKTFRFSCF
ncbi:hypothetical protein NHH03_16270 [Stieleria sp. TO1_6]|uniref:hypothetical protein n=1 Tax=Stieleria tagensis TaxID=2956795 RepID=UPI00209B173C|nr:hypothetical protein [Stieleria tagensis]MCO8123306.1 hypothetical protein [Stieleria tagensis]